MKNSYNSMGAFDGHSSAVRTITSRRFKPIELECNNYITNMTKQVTLHTKIKQSC